MIYFLWHYHQCPGWVFPLARKECGRLHSAELLSAVLTVRKYYTKAPFKNQPGYINCSFSWLYLTKFPEKCLLSLEVFNNSLEFFGNFRGRKLQFVIFPVLFEASPLRGKFFQPMRTSRNSDSTKRVISEGRYSNDVPRSRISASGYAVGSLATSGSRYSLAAEMGVP